MSVAVHVLCLFLEGRIHTTYSQSRHPTVSYHTDAFPCSDLSCATSDAATRVTAM